MVKHNIDLNTEELHAFCRKWKIKELCVFGSVLRDDFRPDSDVDFLVLHEDDAAWDLLDAMRMEDDLSKLIGRPVDMVDRSALESSGNHYVQRAIFSTAKPVYGKR